ncbi:MAG: hypothetical protein K9L59_02195 [Desulfobacterales bacterium]|nr:hypothetical protein [Desulfobacterales bacterium]
MKVGGQQINVTNLVICTVGILILVVVGIFPAHQTLKELDQKIAALQYQVKEQNLLFPLFVQLLQRSRQEAPPLLPAPEPKKLPRGETAVLTNLFREIADTNNIAVESLRPDVESLIAASGRFKMLAELSGGFYDLRSFLIQLGGIPYLGDIEHLRLQSATEDRTLQVTMRFWVLQE